jgi:hypothetical protein
MGMIDVWKNLQALVKKIEMRIAVTWVPVLASKNPQILQ